MKTNLKEEMDKLKKMGQPVFVSGEEIAFNCTAHICTFYYYADSSKVVKTVESITGERLAMRTFANVTLAEWRKNNGLVGALEGDTKTSDPLKEGSGFH